MLIACERLSQAMRELQRTSKLQFTYSLWISSHCASRGEQREINKLIESSNLNFLSRRLHGAVLVSSLATVRALPRPARWLLLIRLFYG